LVGPDTFTIGYSNYPFQKRLTWVQWAGGLSLGGCESLGGRDNVLIGRLVWRKICWKRHNI